MIRCQPNNVQVIREGFKSCYRDWVLALAQWIIQDLLAGMGSYFRPGAAFVLLSLGIVNTYQSLDLWSE